MQKRIEKVKGDINLEQEVNKNLKFGNQQLKENQDKKNNALQKKLDKLKQSLKLK